MGTILIVGGTSGVGLATARLLAAVSPAASPAPAGGTAVGHTVHVAGRSAAKLDVLPAGLVGHRLDGNDRAAVASLAAALAPIDALVITLSGSEGSGTLAELDLAGLRRAFEAKFWPVMTVLQAALPHLAERASITVVGAISAHAAMPGTAGIGALNAAVEALVRPLAVEIAPVRVNAVSPGLIDTPWWDGLPEQARNDYFAAAAKSLPIGHVSTAEEIAQAVALVATNTSMTGTVLKIDGGASLVQL